MPDGPLPDRRRRRRRRRRRSSVDAQFLVEHVVVEEAVKVETGKHVLGSSSHVRRVELQRVSSSSRRRDGNAATEPIRISLVRVWRECLWRGWQGRIRRRRRVRRTRKGSGTVWCRRSPKVHWRRCLTVRRCRRRQRRMPLIRLLRLRCTEEVVVRSGRRWATERAVRVVLGCPGPVRQHLRRVEIRIAGAARARARSVHLLLLLVLLRLLLTLLRWSPEGRRRRPIREAFLTEQLRPTAGATVPSAGTARRADEVERVSVSESHHVLVLCRAPRSLSIPGARLFSSRALPLRVLRRVLLHRGPSRDTLMLLLLLLLDGLRHDSVFVRRARSRRRRIRSTELTR